MYYKVVKEKLTFDEAIEAFEDNKIIQYKNYKPMHPSDVRINDFRFTLEQVQGNDWKIVENDYYMEDLKRQVSDMVHEMGIDIDTRFYNEEIMNISTYWQILNDRMFFDDKLAYEIIKWIYDNKKYKSIAERMTDTI